MTGVDRKRSLSRESRLLACLQRDCDERGTAEHHVDPDEQAERPEERPWQARDDDTRGRCHVVESLMRVRRVSQLKSCGGDDFAPRLHG